MKINNHHNGFAIAIAWPETYCRQPGYWYDAISNLVGWSNNYYYKVGHAALLLVDELDKKCHYFDFGRYHTPYKHGRVRSATTDPGLAVKTIPIISKSGKQIENISEILTELQLNAECHGEGNLYASYCRANFRDAYSKAFQLQQNSPIPYGPFKYKGSNCSRFVNASLLAGRLNWKSRIKLKYFVPLTPMPLNNVNALPHKTVLPKMLAHTSFCPEKITDRSILSETLRQPVRHSEIPETAQWLSGEGVGSWFHIASDKSHYFISRYNQDGDLECKGRFRISNHLSFEINAPFNFTHLSHCTRVCIKQNDKVVELLKIN